jgi:putative transposase
MKREYYRHLPHQIPDGAPIFLTWNLKGAIPKAVVKRLQRERNRLDREPQRTGESVRDRSLRQWKVLFAQADQFLDTSNAGPLFLRDAVAAQIVEDAILDGSSDQFTLWAWCVMANHVHSLLTPHTELSEITQRLKGSTSYKINQSHDLIGRVVWQDESYDHWARDEDEMLRIIHYIENNPVNAGLCSKASDWRWSSARLRDRWPAGKPYVGQALA